MSFQSTVLSKGASHLWRLDELSGPTAVDAAGTTDAVYFPEAVFGRPSPVVSDPSSRAVGKRVALATVAAPTASWSYGGFLFTNPDLDTVLLARNGQDGLAGGNYIFWDSGLARIRFNVANSGADVELDFPALPSTWYWVLGTRNGTVVSLYVNDALVDQSSSFSAAAMDGAWVSTGTWKIGCFGDTGNLQNLGDAIDEPCVFPSPLTLTDSIEIYESAINATLLHGRSDANPTAILRSDFEPDPISFPFRHNWTETLIERISFRSSISEAVTGVEESVAEIEAPRRELEWTQVMRNNRERRKLRALLWANQHRKWFIPIRQYAERLLQPLSLGAVSTAISTAYKDYEVGSWIGFRQIADSGEIVHHEERLITALSLNSIGHEALTHNYAAYLSIVYPIRRGLLHAQISVKGHTDAVEEVTLTARLLPEDEQITPNRITQFTPTIKYRDVEVFDGRIWESNDWSEKREYEIERSGERVDFDTGLIGFESDTAGASETFSYRMTIDGHEQIAAFLGWYYERVGMLRYVWVPTMQEDFEILFVNTSEDQIEVRDTNYSDAFALAEPRRDLAFVYWDGTMRYRRVIAFEVFGSNEKLRLDTDVPTLTNLRFVSLLKYCRLDADQLELAWQTDNKIQVAWRFREPLHTPEGIGVSSLSPSSSLSGSVSPSGSASPSSSVSPSLSASLSMSPSASLSPSSSTSISVSPSVSASTSPSHSASPST